MEKSISEPDYYTAIGRIASAWAHFEFIINHAIWELANVEQHAGACITAHIAAPGPRFRSLIALFQLRGISADNISALNSLSGSAEKVGRQRNRIVHDASLFRKSTGEFSQLRITADRKLDFGFVPVSITELKTLEDRIAKLASDCGHAIQNAFDSLPPYDKRQFQLSACIHLNRREQGSSHIRP
jgi:hypothetical protein